MPTSAIGRAMPISKATDPAPIGGSENGFSLTELMIVVFIIGVVSSFILLTAAPTASPAEEKADDVRQMLEQVSQEAMISGQPYGVVISESRVQIVRLSLGNWVPVESGSVEFPSNVGVSFTRSGDGAADGQPDIVFDPLGSASATQLILSSAEDAFVIDVDAGANITVEEPGV